MFYVGSKSFSNLMKAVEETRKNGVEKKISIEFGYYENVHAHLDERDSGLVIKGDVGKPVLRGGVRVSGWKHEGRDLYSLELPSEVMADIRILEINGRLKQRSRYPDTGFIPHLSKYDVTWVSTSGGGFKTMPTMAERSELTYDPYHIPRVFDWQDTEITVMHRWDESTVCIQSHDEVNHKIHFSTPCGNPPGSFEVQEYAVWNSASSLYPGRWRVDKSARKLYYRPLLGESMDDPIVYIPIHDSIISIKGPAQDIRIENLVFATTSSPLVNIYYHRANMPNTYGAMDVPGAIDSDGILSNCEFMGLEFSNIGGWGIRLNGENSNITVSRCAVANAGGGGIRIKNGQDCNITGNKITDIGLVHYSSIGIYVSGCNVINNYIENVPYTGISLTDGPGMLVADNHVKNAMEVLNDGAGIYVTFGNNGIMRGNLVENIPHTGHPHFQRHGLYIDEQANGWIAEGNITINCNSAFLSHMNDKGGNIIRNNVFASHDGDVMLLLIRCDDHEIIGNTFHAKGAVIFAGRPGAITHLEDNRIYSEKHQQVDINDDYKWSEPYDIT
ncbi:MAG: right-handed parallel beta-helix repeat-containing protein [Defluviitaleaceae bacterium]|nr:right-handed parallel beta-helix repeat-containing protein [Defluviitaleaceae bacterium]